MALTKKQQRTAQRLAALGIEVDEKKLKATRKKVAKKIEKDVFVDGNGIVEHWRRPDGTMYAKFPHGKTYSRRSSK